MVFFPFFSDSLAPRFLFIGDIYIYIYISCVGKEKSIILFSCGRNFVRFLDERKLAPSSSKYGSQVF